MSEAPAPTRAEEGRELPSDADFLRETVKVVEWQRDSARQERNEEHARAAQAEAEVARLTAALAEAERERDEAKSKVAELRRDWRHGKRLRDLLRVEITGTSETRDAARRQHMAAEASASALRERVAVLEVENQCLRIAFHDATRRPLGVTPDSGAEFYDQQMADEAEKRRAGTYIQELISRVGRAEAAARTALKAPHADGAGGFDDGR